jgi:ornithine decarboxylase
MEIYRCAADYIRLQRPDRPVLALRPHAAERAARWFIENFPGKSLYAVKANNAPQILHALHKAGVRDFDVASLAEIEQVCGLDDAHAHVMHPIKSRHLIREAYFSHGIRTFAVDCQAELEKVLAETGNARDLTIMVRMACPNTFSEIPLENKFGLSWHESADLLRLARQKAERLGLTFHVGSQAMAPTAFSHALRTVSQQIVHAGVLVDVMDVGGGFPSRYPGMEPPPLSAYVDEIRTAFEQVAVGWHCELWAEPGRALVAESESVIVRVEARKGDTLYVNDGAYGTLFDAAHMKFTYPARRLDLDGDGDDMAPLAPFALYGPTCDSIDYMPGPFYLPESIGEGDHIEIGNLGAYGRVMATQFNGFGRYDMAIMRDEPTLSMYQSEDIAAEAASS